MTGLSTKPLSRPLQSDGVTRQPHELGGIGTTGVPSGSIQFIIIISSS